MFRDISVIGHIVMTSIEGDWGGGQLLFFRLYFSGFVLVQDWKEFDWPAMISAFSAKKPIKG
jgi:hypothetical protein